MFNVVTSISLLELCDANQPALRKLAIEAPGTYSHSLLLGSLVEPACETIGANGLLARVGAYFHDIGKVNKPQYFAENMSQVGNGDHSRLKPTMSKLIITSHIKDGLDMARQYGLPKAVNAFIAQHHGTTVIEYFYNEARKAAEEDQTVDDTEYRYAGPKPQSKETAVLMLADSTEGAVRSIKEPTAPKIEDKVHEIVMKRLLDGQLNESGLTLKDVQIVEQSLCKSLISVYHGRIPYPEADEPETGNRREADGPSPVGGPV
jgi:putative nucleotidyltransferase with HDIG domain